MKLIQLKYFSSIVENGGFIAASNELGVAQPALSRQIGELEAELGAELLKRGPAGTAVTDAGQRFYQHTRSILEQLEIASEDVRQRVADAVGEVRIAIPFGFAELLAPKIIQRMEQDHPGVVVTIVDGLGYQAGHAVDAGTVDFGIIANVVRLPNVTFQPVLRENMFLFSKRKGTRPDTSPISLAELEGQRLIMPNRKVHVRRFLEEALMDIGRNATISYEQQSLLTIRSMVRSGVGATVLNWPSMADVWHTGDLDARQIVDPALTRVVALAAPTIRPMTNAARVVRQITRQIMVAEVTIGNWKGDLISGD